MAEWDSRASRLRIASLEAGTTVTSSDIRANVGGQPGPIVLSFNEFLGFLIAWVAGDRGVMMGRDDVHTQRIVIRNIHPTRGIIEEAVVFLADPFLFA